MNFLYKISIVIFITLTTAGCKKFIDVDAPVTNLNGANVYETDATAIAAVTSMYTKMSETFIKNGGLPSISLFAGLSADELTLFNSETVNSAAKYYYTNGLSSTNVINPDYWTVLYKSIFTANAAIDGLNTSNGLNEVVKRQLLGEARFMRAFSFFYLVNLYGDVPLTTSTDWTINSTLTRTAASEVYDQVINDLTEAQELLSANFLDQTLLSATEERVRPTKWAATALLARVNLYLENWTVAEQHATALINETSKFALPSSLNEVFLKNSDEAIWQLQPVIAGQNTPDAWVFILPAIGPDVNDHPVYLSEFLMDNFDSTDGRQSNWVGTYIDTTIAPTITYHYPYKYKIADAAAPVTEYEMIFRLAEQYLIRAEARAQLGNTDGAQEDLNTIRSRVGLANTTATTTEELVDAILRERQLELFTEWGHRWLDLKRTGKIDAVMNAVTPVKGGGWNSNYALYPINATELEKNPQLFQNNGY